MLKIRIVINIEIKLLIKMVEGLLSLKEIRIYDKFK